MRELQNPTEPQKACAGPGISAWTPSTGLMYSDHCDTERMFQLAFQCVYFMWNEGTFYISPKFEGKELHYLVFHYTQAVMMTMMTSFNISNKKWTSLLETWSAVVWTANWNEQTPWTASLAGRYSDASTDCCNHDTQWHTANMAHCVSVSSSRTESQRVYLCTCCDTKPWAQVISAFFYSWDGKLHI